MASTNKTTYYDLSQYTANDKPTYLVDYNTDMANIDAGIHAVDVKAGTSITNIGTMADLQTTEKGTLVGAVNEVKASTVANATNIAGNTTNIGTLANLDTVNKSDLVNAINEVARQFNLGNPTIYDNNSNPFTCDNGSVSYGNITVVTNSNGTIAKIYGAIVHTPTNDLRKSNITIGNSSLRPTSDITINYAGSAVSFSENATYGADIVVKTNGDIQLSIPARPNKGLYFVFSPFVYFIKDFGDTPVTPVTL